MSEQYLEEESRYMGVDFADFLRSMKELSGEPRDSMAEALGVSLRVLYSYFAGDSLPNSKRQEKIAGIFELSDSEQDILFDRPNYYLSAEERRIRNEPLGTSLGSFLRSMQELSGKTRGSMAEALGVSSRMIDYYLANDSIPSVDTQQQIADIFELSEEEIAAVTGTPKPAAPLTSEERRQRNELLGLDFEEFIEAIRFLSGMSKRAISTAIGLSSNAICEYTSHSRVPRERNQRIRQFFMLSDQELASLFMTPSRRALEERDRKLKQQLGETTWKSWANCRGVDNKIFYARATSAESLKARNICRHCKVSKTCLDYALSNTEEEGIWGGTDEEERQQMREVAL